MDEWAEKLMKKNKRIEETEELRYLRRCLTPATVAVLKITSTKNISNVELGNSLQGVRETIDKIDEWIDQQYESIEGKGKSIC